MPGPTDMGERANMGLSLSSGMGEVEFLRYKGSGGEYLFSLIVWGLLELVELGLGGLYLLSFKTPV